MPNAPITARDLIAGTLHSVLGSFPQSQQAADEVLRSLARVGVAEQDLDALINTKPND